MAITFILNDKAVNDQTIGLQIGDNADDPFTDTDVAYSSLPASFRTYLETTLGLSSAFPTSIGVATKTNSVTVNATAGSQLAGTTFTDGSGGALDGDDSLLKTADGKEIFLYADGSNTVIGKYDSDGIGGVDSIAFVIFKEDLLNAGKTSDAVTFHIVTYVPIFHGDSTNPDDAVDLGNTLKLAATETLNFGFAGAPSGSNLFMMFGDPTSTQIVVIGQHPLNQSEGGNITTKDVLNISQAGSTTSFGVNGNAINPTEGAYITYVSGANTNFLVPNLDQNEADVEANIAFTDVVNATGASFTVNQTNPGVGPVTVKISAFTTTNQSGTSFVDGLTDDTHVAITSFSLTDVVVKTGNTQFTPDASIVGGNLIITGLSTGDKVSWTTSATHNRVLIENISGADGISGNDNNTFDIGGFGIVTSSGSSTFVGQQIVIEDDGPTASQAQQTGTVDEDGVPGGIAGGTGDVAGEVTVASGSVTPLFNSGTDVPLTFSLNSNTSGLPALTSGGVAVIYSVVGNTLTASAGGNTVFTFALNGTTGAWTFTLADQLDHPTLNGLSGDDTENDLTINLSSILRATDADGDTAAAAANALIVTVDDDTPTASQAQQTGTVDEDGVPGGIAGGLGDVAGEATQATGSVTPLFNSGADAPLTFSLNSNTSGLPALTSGGAAVTYSVVGNTLTASAGGNTVFTFALNATSGAWTFTLADQLDHPTLNGLPGDNTENDLAINVSSILRATDADGDTVAAAANALIVTVDDDTPTINPAIADGLVDFAAGSTVTKSLNGSVGADSPATYSITNSPATLTILDGTSSQVTLLRELTNSDTVATYYKDVDSSGTHNAGDIDFFKLTLSGGNYTFDVLQNPPPADLNFSFAGAPSGSNLFMMFGDPNSAQIVVIGHDPLNQSNGGNITTKDVLNISQAGSTTSFGVNGNAINPTEGAFITYVSGANTNFLVPNLDQNEADVEANIAFTNVFNANTASFTVNQTNPGVGPVTVKISAFTTSAEPGTAFVDGLTNDTHVNITSFSLTDVVVKTGNTQFTPDAHIDGGGNLIITGLSTGDKVTWTTSATHDRVLIENISNADGIAGNDNNTFDIGGFGLVQTQPAPDEKLDFTVQIADFDGDTASDSFSIGIDGTGIFNDNHVEGVIA